MVQCYMLNEIINLLVGKIREKLNMPEEILQKK